MCLLAVRAHFYQMEGAYLISTNVEHWHNLQDIQLSMLDGKEVENAGDGTCDLPGH